MVVSFVLFDTGSWLFATWVLVTEHRSSVRAINLSNKTIINLSQLASSMTKSNLGRKGLFGLCFQVVIHHREESVGA